MTEFPQYRKYVGVDTWFKIVSVNHFIELKQIGDRMVRSEVEANQFPELNFIQDMLACKDQRWEEISEQEFDHQDQ